jgi:hypothetical protein
MSNLFLKLLLLSGIPFGFLISILSTKNGEISNIILNGILSGMVFGTLVSYILISLHKSLSRKVVTDSFNHDFAIHQKRRIELPISYEDAYSLCLQSLNVINRSSVTSQSINKGEIRARAGLNWKTWGDNVFIKLIKGEGSTIVEISSMPSARSTLVDFGKNLDNVERIKRFLLDH